MKNKGNGTVIFENKPSVVSFAAIAGKKEGEGPLGKYFDKIIEDAYNGEKTWEKAETSFLQQTAELAMEKGGFRLCDIDFFVAGDLMNQCTPSGFTARSINVPFLGVYGACSTMAESLIVGSLLVSGGGANYVMCATGSHFCSAEKQYRMPLEYGGQRTPVSQWTVTASGAAILGKTAEAPFIDSLTAGKIVDLGVKDSTNMGAAMAPAFCDTLKNHLEATSRTLDYYDLILSGDLGITGKKIAEELLQKDGIKLHGIYKDCGEMIFDANTQDTHSGGSGCGCAASTLCGVILPLMKKGKLKRVLLCATGALLSPITSMQGESIPSISHAISFEA